MRKNKKKRQLNNLLKKKKIKSGFQLDLNHCIFCRSSFEDLERNVYHMEHAHGLFIPDIEYLKDLKGLISYMGEKVTVGNACVFCHKIFRSFESVQAHMSSLNHCKFSDDFSEFEDFYDFSSSYAKYGDNVDEETLLERVKKDHEIRVSEDGSELILPDGKAVGHRSFFLFYKQRLRPPQTQESILINQLLSQYRLLTYDSCSKNSHSSSSNQVITAKNIIADKTRLCVKANKLQRHCRDPTRLF